MHIRYKAVSLPFRFPFTISKGTKTEQPALLVELTHFAIKGYGEAPAIAYYHMPVDQMIADLEAKKPFVEKFAFSDPERYWHYLHHLFPNNHFLVCALDMAAWDIYGKIKRQPLHRLWGLDTQRTPLTNYTIGIDTIDRMLEKMNANPWPVYKIKMGMEGDLEMIAALRKHTDAVFRVDVNEGWTLEQALQKIPVLKDLGVELVEQPLHKTDTEGMKRLFQESVLPVFADEACVKESDVETCNQLFHGINIKLTKCSGITPARRMIRRAREFNMQVMIGCMNESAIGSAAIAQLAPMVDYLDVDGPLLLSANNGESIGYDYGRIRYNELPGLGVTIREALFD